MRLNDWCYMSSWSWINYWPNFFAGMNHDLHAWKPNDHANRSDGVDGWGSPLVKFVQKSLSPYLIQDRGILNDNPGPPRGHEKGQAQWPYHATVCGVSGEPIERSIEVFNGGLFGRQLVLRWNAHWDAPDGPLAVEGGDIPCEIEPGFHATKKISFTVPRIQQDRRTLYLAMESRKDGKSVFREEGTCLDVVRRHTFTLGSNDFLLDGKPFQIRAGEIQPNRVPNEYWRQRIRMAKAMGLNTISSYVFWAYHEVGEGKFDFKTWNRDIGEFFQIAKEEGMWVLFPGAVLLRRV